jgi:hypothetical protein
VPKEGVRVRLAGPVRAGAQNAESPAVAGLS